MTALSEATGRVASLEQQLDQMTTRLSESAHQLSEAASAHQLALVTQDALRSQLDRIVEDLTTARLRLVGLATGRHILPFSSICVGNTSPAHNLTAEVSYLQNGEDGKSNDILPSTIALPRCDVDDQLLEAVRNAAVGLAVPVAELVNSLASDWLKPICVQLEEAAKAACSAGNAVVRKTEDQMRQAIQEANSLKESLIEERDSMKLKLYLAEKQIHQLEYELVARQKLVEAQAAALRPVPKADKECCARPLLQDVFTEARQFTATEESLSREMSLSICAQRKWAEAQREADSWCRKYAGLRAAYSVELARLTGQTDKSHSVIDSLASASSRPLNRTHSEAENTFLQSHRPSETQLQISPHHNQSKLRHQTQVEATRRRSVGEALLANQPVQEENHEDSLSYKTDSLSEQQTDEDIPALEDSEEECLPVPLDLASMPKLPIDQHQFQTNSFASEGPNISSRRARSLALSTTEKPFDQCDDPITRCRHRYTTRSLRKTSTKSTCQTKSAIDEGAQRQAQIQQEMRFLSLRMDGLEVIASSIKDRSQSATLCSLPLHTSTAAAPTTYLGHSYPIAGSNDFSGHSYLKTPNSGSSGQQEPYQVGCPLVTHRSNPQPYVHIPIKSNRPQHHSIATGQPSFYLRHDGPSCVYSPKLSKTTYSTSEFPVTGSIMPSETQRSVSFEGDLPPPVQAISTSNQSGIWKSRANGDFSGRLIEGYLDADASQDTDVDRSACTELSQVSQSFSRRSQAYSLMTDYENGANIDASRTLVATSLAIAKQPQKLRHRKRAETTAMASELSSSTALTLAQSPFLLEERDKTAVEEEALGGICRSIEYRRSTEPAVSSLEFAEFVPPRAQISRSAAHATREVDVNFSGQQQIRVTSTTGTYYSTPIDPDGQSAGQKEGIAVSSTEESYERLTELQRRNLLQPQHLRTSYPVETQMCQLAIFTDAIQRQAAEQQHLASREQSEASVHHEKSDEMTTFEVVASSAVGKHEPIRNRPTAITCDTSASSAKNSAPAGYVPEPRDVTQLTETWLAASHPLVMEIIPSRSLASLNLSRLPDCRGTNQTLTARGTSLIHGSLSKLKPQITKSSTVHSSFLCTHPEGARLNSHASNSLNPNENEPIVTRLPHMTVALEKLQPTTSPVNSFSSSASSGSADSSNVENRLFPASENHHNSTEEARRTNLSGKLTIQESSNSERKPADPIERSKLKPIAFSIDLVGPSTGIPFAGDLSTPTASGCPSTAADPPFAIPLPPPPPSRRRHGDTGKLISQRQPRTQSALLSASFNRSAQTPFLSTISQKNRLQRNQPQTHVQPRDARLVNTTPSLVTSTNSLEAASSHHGRMIRHPLKDATASRGNR